MSTTLAFVLALILAVATTAKNLTRDFTGQEGGHTTIGGSVSLRCDIFLFSCPQVEEIIFSGVLRAISADRRMAASLLRLHFHDCFVNGCDASVLLDDTSNFVGEKTARPNLNSARGFDVIDSIKAEIEMACPQTVSCADILAVAARDSVVLSGGPTWQVEMGRMDSLTASKNGADNNIPVPTSDVANLTQKFQNVGLSQKDMVALSGAHTIGNARCTSFRSRLSGANGGDQEFLSSLQQLCSTGSNDTLANLDLSTPVTFDNQYYINLMAGEGLLASDQVLASGNDNTVSSQVANYASDIFAFHEDFTESMVRMGRLGWSSGSTGGEVRKDCRVVN